MKKVYMYIYTVYHLVPKAPKIAIIYLVPKAPKGEYEGACPFMKGGLGGRIPPTRGCGGMDSPAMAARLVRARENFLDIMVNQ